MEVPEAGWVLCQQVHGTAVADVGRLEKGRGAMDHWSAIPRTDGLLTLETGVGLGVLTADCLPLILVDTSRPAVAVVHAGWRGMLSGIAARGLDRLRRRTGAAAADLLAFIGPHIGPCCMEVGEEVADAFRAISGGSIAPGPCGASLDLTDACREELVSGGMLEGNIYDSGVCTACSDDYFSFRGDPGCGRQMAFACIRGGAHG